MGQETTRKNIQKSISELRELARTKEPIATKFRDALLIEAIKKKKITDDQEIFDTAVRIENNIKHQVLLECSENIESEPMTIVIKV